MEQDHDAWNEEFGQLVRVRGWVDVLTDGVYVYGIFVYVHVYVWMFCICIYIYIYLMMNIVVIWT